MVKQDNRFLVLDFIRKNEEFTLTQLTKNFQLSKTTLWKIVDHFVNSELVIPSGKLLNPNDVGKKPELFKLNENYGYSIAAAIYSTSILLGIANIKGKLFYKEVVNIPADSPLDKILEIIADFVRKVQGMRDYYIPQGSRFLGVGIASTGVTNPHTGVCYMTPVFPSWGEDAPVMDLLMEKIGYEVPMYVDNYSRFFAYAERKLGCAKNANSIVDVVINQDGVGSGIIINNAMAIGAECLAGSIGHIRVDPDSQEKCHCGGRGCLEQNVLHDHVIQKVIQNKAAYPNSLLAEIEDNQLDIQAIFNAADEDDRLACDIVSETASWLARGIHNATMVVDPDIVVISGDYKSAGDFFMEKLQGFLDELSFFKTKRNRVVTYSCFDNDGAIIGASIYAVDMFFSENEI